MLFIFLFLGLFRTVQASKSDYALLGTVLGVLAFAMICAGISTEYTTTSFFSDS